MKTMEYLENIISAMYLLRYRKSFDKYYVGKSSSIYLWRVRPNEKNTLCVGKDSSVQTRIFFGRPFAKLFVGNKTFIGNGVISVAERVDIGNEVLVSWGVTILDHQSHSLKFSERADDVKLFLRGEKDWSHVPISPVTIEDKAWIGVNSIILNGITIGEGAIVGAGSVVTHDVPAWTIVAGNPARIIREITQEFR
jgi:acetyltransferase-like isoleucine patch superfamily enzyme